MKRSSRHLSRARIAAFALALLAIALVACDALGGRGGPAKPPPPGTEDLAVVIDHTLYVQRLGGARRALVTTSGPSLYPAAPRWSPDGTQVAYVERRLFPSEPGGDWGDDVYLVPLAGGEPKLVRKHTAPGRQVNGIAWLPDGRGLLLGDVRTSPDGTAASSTIVRLDLASGAETALVQHAIEPSTARDGRISYLRESGDTLALMTAEPDGTGARELVSAGVFPVIRFPRIAPDGRSVLFSAPNPSRANAPPWVAVGCWRGSSEARGPRHTASRWLSGAWTPRPARDQPSRPSPRTTPAEPGRGAGQLP